MSSARSAISVPHTRNSGSCFLVQDISQICSRQLKDELRSFKYKGEYKHTNFQMYIAQHKKIYLQMQNLKTEGYAGINFKT